MNQLLRQLLTRSGASTRQRGGRCGCVHLQEDVIQNTVGAQVSEELEACSRDSSAAETHAYAAFER